MAQRWQPSLLHDGSKVSFLDLFDLKPQERRQSPGETDTVRKIVEALDRLDPESARYLAAFSYVLSRVARADLTVTPEETRAMEAVVVEHGGLPADQAIIVLQMAKH